SYTPDLVVINLGTNDFAQGDPGMPYEQAYEKLIQQVRSHYPNAFIVCATGSMLSGDPLTKQKAYVNEAVHTMNQNGDARVSYADLGLQDANDGLGCDWHPSLVTQQKMATRLTAAIKAVTGW